MRSSLHPDYLGRLRFSLSESASLTALAAAQGRQELYFRQTPEVLESLRQVAVIESSESSNRLEGIRASRGRIEEMVRREAAPRNRSEQEIAGYRDALALIHELHEGMDFSRSVILQLHDMLYRYHPGSGGSWKPVDNEIVETDAEGQRRVRFYTVPAVETPQAMETLCRQTREAMASEEPLVVVPLAVLDFLCIHPFRDGNGRVARLLTLLLLYKAGYRVGKYISLERVFEESRDSYYETLEISSQGWHEGEHDAMPWLTYFWGVLLRAYEEFEKRVGQVEEGRGSKSRRVKRAVRRRTQPFAISDIARDCPGVSKETIRGVLGELRNRGELVLEGKGRGAVYRRREL